MKQVAMLQAAQWRHPHGKELKAASGQQTEGTEVLSLKELNSACSHVSLEVGPSPVKRSDETPALTDIFTAVCDTACSRRPI